MNLSDFPSWCIIGAFFLATGVSTGMIFNNVKPSLESYLPNYDFYHNISRMNECLRHISARYSEIVDAEMQYRSRLGLSQYVLHITNFSLDATNKKSLDRRSKVLFSYGEHAAEFFPVQSMFYLLKNITHGYDLPPETYGRNFTRFVLNNFDLYILTIVNPDGRALIETTRNHCWIGTANNVDLNSDLQKNTGNGKSIRIIAEPECRVIRELTSAKNFDALISFHSGQRQIIFPNGEKNAKVPEHSEVHHLASLISSSLTSHFSLVPLKSSVGDEGIFAYSATEKMIPFTYKICLWGSEERSPEILEKDCFSTLNPPSKNLQAEVEAVYPLYPTLFNYIHYWKESQLYNKAEQLAQLEDAETKRLSFTTVLFFILGCTGVYLVCQMQLPFSWKLFFRRQRRIVSLRSLGTLFTLLNFP